MNKILAFDTSNNNCSVAISSGQDILFFELEQAISMQAEKLMCLVEKALYETKMNYKDLDYIAVTTGPGSFTSIRVGLAAAKGIICASGIKSIGISNFDLGYYRLKMQVKNYDYAFIIINAYRDQLYVQEFSSTGEKTEPYLMDNADIVNILKNRSKNTVCAGNGLSVIYKDLKAKIGEKLFDRNNNITILPRFPYISAMHLARLADEKIKMGEFAPIEPLYIRKPDAAIPS